MRRRTRALVQVALALLEDPTGRHWGYELSKRADVRSGVLYPMLTRMLDEGFVQDGWEDPNTLGGKRPPRRYYELTHKGRLALEGIVQHAFRDSRFADLFATPGSDPPKLSFRGSSPNGRFA